MRQWLGRLSLIQLWARSLPFRVVGSTLVAAVVILVATGWFLLDQFIPWLNFGTIWPIGLVAIGAIILVAALRRSG